MTDLRTAAQMALDALRETETYNTGNQEQYRLELDAMEALRAALSRPEPEPVADGIQVIEHVRNVQYKIKSRYHLENGTELYTAPPKRDLIPLDDEELLRCECDAEGDLSLMAKLILQRMMEKNP